MIRTLDLTRFRGFNELRMEKLGRINLLVGGNNSGKTSILEAIELLLAHGDPRSIWTALSRRGERLWEQEERGNLELDICRLFHEYHFKIGSSLAIRATGDGSEQHLQANIVELSEPDQRELPNLTQDLQTNSGMQIPGGVGLQLTWKGGLLEKEDTLIPITDRGGLSFDGVRRRVRRDENRQPVSFVSTSSLSSEEVVSLLSRYILNPEEDLVLKALRIIDKRVERIAPVAGMHLSNGFSSGMRGGVVIKLKGIESRLPIGTMGDGIWRLLSLALSLIGADRGVLLVDEIDTGLHYSTMENMWKLVYQTALRLNIQIFATTHSADCWKALATVCRDPAIAAEASLQHIEQDKRSSKPFVGREILIAAERGFEVR